ncbi:FAD-dependent oxidoreductase [Pseudonocardia yuanmonensis]|uniref:FAD-dependent oxidoreductase n=1 Tax=Pseudonocardia yuanmonensis TaxID=1095914 RepID=A0ABP8WR08_9PSEU
MLLTYLLARGGVPVTLLEAPGDFDRRFRGDTLAPPVLDYLDALGLAEPLLAAVPHARADAFRWHTPSRTYTLADYRWASRRFGYYALIPQARFLPWLARRAEQHGARILMGARFRTLLRDADDRVCGVEYTHAGAAQQLTADVVIGADGRSSKVRHASRLVATELGANLDILWYAVPRRPDDPDLSGLDLFAAPGTTVVLLGQEDSWQVGYDIPAGTLPEVRARGLAPIIDAITRVAPWLGDRLDTLTDLNQLTLLPVRITRLDRWTEPGLLLIGDAAHVISPVGGNGINFALADAAEAANQLLDPLRADPVDPGRIDAAAHRVEVRRRPPIDREQASQLRIEKDSADRLRRGDPRPAGFLQLVATIPGLPRLIGRQTRKLRLPAPVPTILDRPALSPPGRRQGSAALGGEGL